MQMSLYVKLLIFYDHKYMRQLLQVNVLSSFTKQVFTYILNTKRNYTILFFYFQCQCKCVLIKISLVKYVPTGVYRTLKSGRFDPRCVEYFDPLSFLNFRTSILCISILKTALSCLSRNDFLYTLLM